MASDSTNGQTGRYGVRLYKQRFRFASAHFLLFSEERRERLHGHNYQVRCELEGGLGADGMVVDFGSVKPHLEAAVGALDHFVLLPAKAPSLQYSESDGELELRVGDGSRYVFPRADVRLLPLENTSTEQLAEWLARRVARALLPVRGGKLSRLRIEVEETGGQCGWFELEGQELLANSTLKLDADGS